jgi:hypothetical protein
MYFASAFRIARFGGFAVDVCILAHATNWHGTAYLQHIWQLRKTTHHAFGRFHP